MLDCKYEKIKNNDIGFGDSISVISKKLKKPLNTGLVYNPNIEILYLVECSPLKENKGTSLFNRQFVLNAYNEDFKQLFRIELPGGSIPIPYLSKSFIYFQMKNDDFQFKITTLHWK